MGCRRRTPGQLEAEVVRILGSGSWPHLPTLRRSQIRQAKAKLTRKSTGRRSISRTDYQAQGVLYLPEAARFSKLMELPEAADIGKAINDAMRATKLDIVLAKPEEAEVKTVAKPLLDKLKQENMVLDWRKQQATRAMVFVTIKEVLDDLPRAFTTELYQQKCDVVDQHFYETYIGHGKSVYTGN